MMFYVLDGKIVSIRGGVKLNRLAAEAAALAFARRAPCICAICQHNEQAAVDLDKCRRELGWFQ